MAVEFVRNGEGFRTGPEDAIILPLVTAALVLKRLLKTVFLFVVRLLDWSFPLVMQLIRFPLFTARVLGDGTIGAARWLIPWLPLSEQVRENWQEDIGRKWSWLRGKLSYKVFEDALHNVFERGMAWVFISCKALTPSQALAVITCAVLWLPVSLTIATAIHALLLAYALVLPAWMQLLHPLATIIAKSKLLVLPVYPAAWPQAKKHPFVQALGRSYGNVRALYLVRKLGCRYRQTQDAAGNAADAVAGAASSVGLTQACNTLSRSFNGTVAALARGCVRGASGAVTLLSRLWVIGPIIRNYESQYHSATQRDGEKASEKLSSFYERWSVRFTAEYYEAKGLEKGTKPCPDRN
jgi:hypothetical protein